MTTSKQITANRRNAAKSTGPRSQSGKARSSRNALKHGLSAERVVMFDEDPAVFDALRSDLFAHFQPADPVSEHLVEQVAVCIWRLKRVPEIEAAIFSYSRHLHERKESERRLDATVVERPLNPMLHPQIHIKDREVHDAAKMAKEQAEIKLQDEEALIGGMFFNAERSLNSLIRIASDIERSMYRAIRELERIKAEGQDTDQHNIIEIEAQIS